MRALISPNESSRLYDGTKVGQRIAQVTENEFPVSEPLFWVDCPDNCNADDWYYQDGQFFKIPASPENSNLES